MSVTGESAGATAIRPFTIPITPVTELEALRARITATRWPDKELVTDHSQGPKLTVMQELARYWATRGQPQSGHALGKPCSQWPHRAT